MVSFPKGSTGEPGSKIGSRNGPPGFPTSPGRVRRADRRGKPFVQMHARVWPPAVDPTGYGRNVELPGWTAFFPSDRPADKQPPLHPEKEVTTCARSSLRMVRSPTCLGRATRPIGSSSGSRASPSTWPAPAGSCWRWTPSRRCRRTFSAKATPCFHQASEPCCRVRKPGGDHLTGTHPARDAPGTMSSAGSGCDPAPGRRNPWTRRPGAETPFPRPGP